MDRRDFLSASAAAAAGLAAGSASGKAQAMSEQRKPFTLKYAPHFGMFSSVGNDIDQLKFAADEGFTAWEDNGMAGRSPEDQEKIAREMGRLGMTMGVFVVNMGTAWKPTFSTGNKDTREQFLDECRAAVDVARRVNAKWMTVVCGTLDGRLEHARQLAHCIDQLRFGAEIFEPHGLVMVLEPLNHRRDHPGMLLARSSDAHLVCRAVNSPSCKILFDIYHQQITEGNLIPNIDMSWDEIGYFQVGDNPGRKEPGTGEINYGNVFGHIRERGFAGVVGMEHGNSKGGQEGERAVIDAYRAADGHSA